MHSRHSLLALTAGAIAAFAPICVLPALAQAPAALTGQVSSAAEGPMEGVLVSARRDGATVTVTVAVPVLPLASRADAVSVCVPSTAGPCCPTSRR